MQPIGSMIKSQDVNYSPLSVASAQKRVHNFMGNAIEMLKQLRQQNQTTAINEDQLNLINLIYGTAKGRIYRLQYEIMSTINQKKPNEKLNKKQIGNLTKQLKAAKKEIAKIIQEAQIQVAAEIGAYKSQDIGKKQYQWDLTPDDVNTVRGKVAILARGGWKAQLIHLLALVSTVNDVAIRAFNASQMAMEQASFIEPAANIEENQIEKDKRTEFKNSRIQAKNLDDKANFLARRAGVIGLKGIYRFQVTFSKEKIYQQFKSFSAQKIGQIERSPVKRTMEINKEPFLSKIIPLNKAFDTYLELSGVVSKTFARILGTGGISSNNRQELHLINGWETNLTYQGKTIFRALRHAILSDKYEKDSEIRAKNSKQAALELIQAALLEEIKTQSLTLKEARQQGITLNLNSVSLVTPDNLRPYLPGQSNEKKMLADQIGALQSFNGAQELELDGKKIQVNVNVNTFNFGVNALAAKYKQGLATQYEYNLIAMQRFREQFKEFHEKISNEIRNIQNSAHSPLSANDRQQRVELLTSARKQAATLMEDIELLMRDKKAYLRGDNQYEIGAKILNLSYLMDQTIETINYTRETKDRISGFKGAFNCMSGKDRTGWMDAIAKTFAIMAELDKEGNYPSHADFMRNPELRQQFAKILEQVLLESGNLEITEINTGAKGYKVLSEARLFGMSAEAFFEAQGLSPTTSS